MAKLETRGRKPLPVDKRKPPQTTVKVNDAILPFVQELKSNLKNKSLMDDTLQRLFEVLHGKSEQQTTDDDIRLKLVQKYDSEHTKAIKLNTRVNSLKSDVKHLKSQIESLQHKEHDCQALTKNGGRCTRPGKLKSNWHGVDINVCLQHSKAGK